MRSRMMVISGAIILAAFLFPAGAMADFGGDTREALTSNEAPAPVPEPGSYEYQDALETGALPPGPGSMLMPSSRRVGVGDTGTIVYLLDPFTGTQIGSSGEASPAVEVGGQSFRPEIDEGP